MTAILCLAACDITGRNHRWKRDSVLRVIPEFTNDASSAKFFSIVDPSNGGLLACEVPKSALNWSTTDLMRELSR